MIRWLPLYLALALCCFASPAWRGLTLWRVGLSLAWPLVVPLGIWVTWTMDRSRRLALGEANRQHPWPRTYVLAWVAVVNRRLG